MPRIVILFIRKVNQNISCTFSTRGMIGNTSVIPKLQEVWWNSYQCMNIQTTEGILSIMSAIIHDNTTNTNKPKKRRHIPYGANRQYRKIHPKRTEVNQ